jgi:DNA topoisomerase-1
VVNAYLRDATGEPFTAKSFRTWGGTVLAAKALGQHDPPADEKAAKGAVADTIRVVAAKLGNTVAVCRRHYLHPDVLDAYLDGTLDDRLRARNAGNTPPGLEPAEAAVLDVLRERPGVLR